MMVYEHNNVPQLQNLKITQISQVLSLLRINKRW